MTGTIKRLTDKGFGFIASTELGKDVFHKNSRWHDLEELREGDAVSFDTEESPKGLNAINVKRA